MPASEKMNCGSLALWHKELLLCPVKSFSPVVKLSNPPSGAAVVAANKLAVRAENKDKLITCILPSFGERWVLIPILTAICFS